jgi:hypothetical protein
LALRVLLRLRQTLRQKLLCTNEDASTAFPNLVGDGYRCIAKRQ